MTLPFHARLLCAALLSFGLIGSAVPAVALDAPPTPSSAATPSAPPPAAAPAETAPSSQDSTTTQKAQPTQAEPTPAAPTEAAPTAPAPSASAAPKAAPKAAPEKITSFVPDLDWNPLEDPDSNARYGEHYVDQSDGLGSAAPSTTDGSGGSAALAPRTGNFKVTLVTVQLSGKTVADTDAINMTAARNSIVSANNYWNSSSAGRLSFTNVREFRHKSAARITDSYGAIMEKVTNELGWQNRPYEALVIFVPHADLSYNGSWGILGGGFTDGPTSGRVIMPYPSALTNNVVSHEFGHVLGLHHANSLACSNGRSDVSRSGGTWTDRECYSAEYSDTTDLMGYAQVSSPRVNAFMWEYGGFGNGQEIRNLGTPTAVTRASLKPWAGTATARAAKFTDPVSKEVYYLEARLAVGYDSQTAIGGNEGVKITKRDNLGWSGNASIVLTPDSRRSGWGNTSLTWQQGQTFTTFAGTKVKIDSLTSAGATVTVTPKVIVPVAPKPVPIAPKPAPVAPVAVIDRAELRFSGPDFTGDGVTD
ncbi:hypothetical protein FQ377_07105, partial [Arthrobacter echini]